MCKTNRLNCYQSLLLFSATTEHTRVKVDIQWCKDVGLLARKMTCHGCGGDMRWETTPEAKVDGYR